MFFIVYAFPATVIEIRVEWTTTLKRYVTKASVRDKPPSAARIAALLEFKMAPYARMSSTTLWAYENEFSGFTVAQRSERTENQRKGAYLGTTKLLFLAPVKLIYVTAE